MTAEVTMPPELPGDTPIWRYMELWKFVSFLQRGKLWFACPFTFKDKWDGLYPPAFDRRLTGLSASDAAYMKEEFAKRMTVRRNAYQVSCWNVCDHETEALWKLYGLNREGIAIQSTAGCFRYYLHDHWGSDRVVYYDPAGDTRTGLFWPDDILWKRQFYSCENEFRVWLLDEELREDIMNGLDVPLGATSGSFMGISDPGGWIKQLLVAPEASASFVKDVRDLCIAYGKSGLAEMVQCSYSERSRESFTIDSDDHTI